MNHLKLVINNTEFFLKKDNNFFNKTELKTILDLYAKMVAEGLWKDYGLNISKKEVSFNVYKRTSENPVIKICKNFRPNNQNFKFFISDSSGNILKMSGNLKMLLKKIRWNDLKLVN